MSGEPLAEAGEVRLAPESVDAIARRLAELLKDGEAQRPKQRLISAEEVSERWGMSRRWVYKHAERLGARRIGTGRRPRLRFDPDEVAERLGEPQGGRGRRGLDMHRLSPSGSDCRPDSLSTHGRAMVGRQAKKRPGRRGNAPRPGAEGGPSTQ
ncbi:MAG: hypothetical protein AB7V58_01225 [Solirubrobacterales bacterium]